MRCSTAIGSRPSIAIVRSKGVSAFLSSPVRDDFSSLHC
jgi:hypothetical protein